MFAAMETEDIAAQAGGNIKDPANVIFRFALQTRVAMEFATVLACAAVPMASSESAVMRTNSSRPKPAARVPVKMAGDVSMASANAQKVLPALTVVNPFAGQVLMA